MNTDEMEYVGFWPRVGAVLIDILVQLTLTAPLTYFVYGRYSEPGLDYMGRGDMFINLVLPAIAVIALWVRYGATPGKMALSAKIVNADTGEPLTMGASLVRYLGYFVSMIPFCVGFIWIAFDRRKQGWHDKMANSVVVRPVGTERVRFASNKVLREGSGNANHPTDPKF
jgi:uncharacterized RDD family membrane protein YckC